jgi:hypothetical protein
LPWFYTVHEWKIHLQNMVDHFADLELVKGSPFEEKRVIATLEITSELA